MGYTNLGADHDSYCWFEGVSVGASLCMSALTKASRSWREPEQLIYFKLREGETAVECCPEGYRCTNRNGNTCVLIASTEETQGAKIGTCRVDNLECICILYTCPAQREDSYRIPFQDDINSRLVLTRDENSADANAGRQMMKTTELKANPVPNPVAKLKAAQGKDHPPPPPDTVVEPPSSDRPDGAVYQVGKLLGKGGFAICHQGYLMPEKKKYALKIVKSQMPSKMQTKFQTELQIHSKMKHRNIVQFLRAFSFNDCTFLVLELCPYGSLMEMVKKRKGLTEPEVRFYSIQIAGAIKYMHSKGIIHRDLKMGNIFLDRNMNTKVGDFGLAALLVTGKDMHTIRRTTLCGTPNYIAPEILEKGKKGHDHMVDIWSLGIIMQVLLSTFLG
ncbi:Cell cycle serine/threonine-protein kinase CDC5/MSD2 like [Verticillium longisporum]|nr:Cell cycle serine/threonine-protein kinase CDC5/MSD2 like [Verticillium longisporum]